jgi:leader peptidase (prepilin peptidase)/N-methyltransferase
MSTPLPVVALIGTLGLVVGSFLNVVIYRVPRELSIVSPSSQCSSCNVPIKRRHNVPVLSWLALRGRCASCRTRVSPRYPLVELGTGLLFAALTMRFGLTLQLPAFLYLAAIGVALALIDFDVRRLPDSIVLPSYVVSVLLLMPAGAQHSDWWSAERGLIGLTVMLAIYFALALAYPNGLGFGDVKLAGLLGLYLGWLSWDALLISIFSTFLIAAVSGTAVPATKRINYDTAVLVGPSLIAATVLSLFIAAPLASWYASVITV